MTRPTTHYRQMTMYHRTRIPQPNAALRKSGGRTTMPSSRPKWRWRSIAANRHISIRQNCELLRDWWWVHTWEGKLSLFECTFSSKRSSCFSALHISNIASLSFLNGDVEEWRGGDVLGAASPEPPISPWRLFFLVVVKGILFSSSFGPKVATDYLWVMNQ